MKPCIVLPVVTLCLNFTLICKLIAIKTMFIKYTFKYNTCKRFSLLYQILKLYSEGFGLFNKSFLFILVLYYLHAVVYFHTNKLCLMDSLRIYFSLEYVSTGLIVVRLIFQEKNFNLHGNQTLNLLLPLQI